MKRRRKLHISYPRYMVSIGLACTLAMLALCSGSVEAQAQGLIVLEDFSSMRMNNDSPPGPLWAPYLYPSDADYANQTGAIENGTYHLTTQGRPYFHFVPYPYVAPKGFAKGNLRSGTWNSQVNRLRFWIKTSANIPRRDDGGTNAEIGTYTKTDDGQRSNQGDHYYHYLDANFVANRWMLVTLNRVPQHKVGTTDPNPTWPENPTASSGWNYYDGLTRFYFCDEYGDPAVWRGDWYFSDFEFDIVTGEPDTLVSTAAVVYTGDHYEISWQGPRNVVQSYTVYAAQASMKATGVAAGTAIGTAQTGGYDYAGVLVASPGMAQPAGGMYFAILPAGQSAFTEIYLPVSPRFTGTGAPTLPHAPTNLRIGN